MTTTETHTLDISPDAEGNMPDMQVKVETDDIFADTPEGQLEAEVIETEPKRGYSEQKTL